MSKDIALAVEDRKVLGKAVKQLRRDGYIPAVIHDHGKPSKVVMAPSLELKKAYQTAGKHHPLSISLGKDTYMALIKDVDFEPKKQQLRHVVFNAIKQDEKVETEVPVHLEGEIPAEKVGLMVITQLDAVTIEAYPKDLVDELKVDATSLTEIGDKLHVSDIVVPSGVTILTEPEHTIAAVEETKAQMSEEEAEPTEGEEAGEGEAAPAEGEPTEAPEASE
jgi:large subunit ribosomal protein L25